MGNVNTGEILSFNWRKRMSEERMTCFNNSHRFRDEDESLVLTKRCWSVDIQCVIYTVHRPHTRYNTVGRGLGGCDGNKITFCFEIRDVLIIFVGTLHSKHRQTPVTCLLCRPGDAAVPRGEQDRGDPVDARRVRPRRHPRPLRLLPVQTHRQRRRE